MARLVGSHSGALDNRVTFRRRQTLNAPQAGNTKGAYQDWLTIWAQFRPLSSHELVIGGLDVDQELADLIVRDNPTTRQITAADRVMIEGQDFAVKSVSTTNRTGFLKISVQRGPGG